MATSWDSEGEEEMPAPIESLFPRLDDPADSFYSALRSIFSASVPVTPRIWRESPSVYRAEVSLPIFGVYALHFDASRVGQGYVYARIPLDVERMLLEESGAPLRPVSVKRVYPLEAYVLPFAGNSGHRLLYSHFSGHRLKLYILLGMNRASAFSPSVPLEQGETEESVYKPEAGMQLEYTPETGIWELYALDSRLSRILIDTSMRQEAVPLPKPLFYGARLDSSFKHLVSYTEAVYGQGGEEVSMYRATVLERGCLPSRFKFYPDGHYEYVDGTYGWIRSTNFIRVEPLGEQVQEGGSVLSIPGSGEEGDMDVWRQNNTSRLLLPSFVRVHPRKTRKSTEPYYEVSPTYREEIELCAVFLDRLNFRLFTEAYAGGLFPSPFSPVGYLPISSPFWLPEDSSSLFAPVLSRAYPGIGIDLKREAARGPDGAEHTYCRTPWVHSSYAVSEPAYTPLYPVDSTGSYPLYRQPFNAAYNRCIDYIYLYSAYSLTRGAFAGYKKRGRDLSLFPLRGSIAGLPAFCGVGELFTESLLGSPAVPVYR